MSEANIVEILVVEDDPHDLALIQRALQKACVTPRSRVARDGADALRFIFGDDGAGGHRSGGNPKVILLDLNLPKLDGLEVLQRLRESPRTKAIPVVVFTSSRDENDERECYRLGANNYIVKPVDFERFDAAVQELGKYWLLLSQPRQGAHLNHPCRSR